MTFADVVRALHREPDVVVAKGFHNDVLKREGKIFAMDYAGAMVFKLPRDRCAALVGDVGIATSCAVYAVRPDVCRACVPGDDACAMARRRFKL